MPKVTQAEVMVFLKIEFNNLIYLDNKVLKHFSEKVLTIT